ncbi:MAG: SprT family zinc-dependent metalloprotease [Bacilli bacterium]|nr:SprT family zinc-dependent metalloprotease [Bacilli bacterium]
MKVNGLTVKVVRKNIKNLHLSVMPANGWVRVSSPMSVDEEAIKLFVISKYGWIIQKQTEFLNQQRESKREYVSGESHFLFGERYLLTIRNSNIYDVNIKGKSILFSVRTNSSTEQREYHFQEWNRRLLKEKIALYIEKWEKILEVKPVSWQIKKMLTKWGSCSHNQKTLLFNLSLAKKPLECVEYVVVHEMCHLIHKNHTKEFYSLLTRHLPFWHETQKTLNQSQLEVYEEIN